MRVESCIVVGRATLPTRFFAAPTGVHQSATSSTRHSIVALSGNKLPTLRLLIALVVKDEFSGDSLLRSGRLFGCGGGRLGRGRFGGGFFGGCGFGGFGGGVAVGQVDEIFVFAG